MLRTLINFIRHALLESVNVKNADDISNDSNRFNDLSLMEAFHLNDHDLRNHLKCYKKKINCKKY